MKNKTIQNITHHQGKHPDLMKRVWSIAFDMDTQLDGAILQNSEEARYGNYYEIKAIFDISEGKGKKYLIVHQRRQEGVMDFMKVQESDFDEVLNVTAAFGIYHSITLGNQGR